MTVDVCFHRFVLAYKSKDTGNLIIDSITYKNKKQAKEQAEFIEKRDYGEIIGIFKVLVQAEVK